MKLKNLIFVFIVVALKSLFFTSCAPSTTDNKKTFVSEYIADTATINSLVNKSSSFVQTNFDSLSHYATQALAMAQSIGFAEGIAGAKAVESNSQRRKGNYTEAVSLALQAIHLYDSLYLVNDLVRIQNVLADIYKEMGGEKGTVEYLKKGLELSRQAQRLAATQQYDEGIVVSLNQQGIILRDMSKRTERKDLMDSAFALYEKAISIVEQKGEGKESLGKLYNNISQVYNEHFSNYPKALEYLFKAVDFNTEKNNIRSLSFNYGNISDVYMHLGDNKKAKFYAHQMLGVSKELNAPHRMVNAYLQLTRVAKQMKEYDSALYYNEWQFKIADSLSNVKKTGQIAEMQTKYETQKKETRITELSQLNKFKNRGLGATIIAIVILVSLLFVLVKQKKTLQKQKEQITEQSEKLQWLMKELHHRVKNNLQIVSSLLNLQSYRLKDEESKAAMKESQLRVQAMSLIHQRLYQVDDVSMVNFRFYINDLAEMLMKAYGYDSDDFDLQVNIEKEYLDVDTVMPLSLLVNEIITNSFKYAYHEIQRPLLKIDMKEDNQQLHLSIADNGIGPQNNTGKNGFGKQLIDALTKQLKAGYTVETTEGVTYLFTIPYLKDKAA